MLKAGLTGSIAVGKSFVISVMRDEGCYVLDADVTAREVVKPGTPGLSAIVEHFGKEVLDANGELDRKRLGSIIFADKDKRELLNSIVHPLVIEAQDAWLRGIEASAPDAIAVIDAALMIESGGYKRFDKLIVVWCDSAIQLQRLMLRDSITADEARRRIEAQMTQDEKKAFADLLIDTSDGFEATRERTIQVVRELRSEADNEKERSM
ncbi:MAG: dephospho-CoA kinase [Acidobacteria bacterium]|nr:dephospho-CoA kinase [Acidobacteriota bacterium]